MKEINIDLEEFIDELVKLKKQGYGKLPISINNFEYEIIDVEYNDFCKPHIEINTQ